MNELEERKKKEISELCKKSLKEKWFRDSESAINDKCPFCYDADIKQCGAKNIEVCTFCLCPKEICGDFGSKGYIATLINNHYHKLFDIKVCNISDEEFDIMKFLFEKYIID